MLQYLLRWLQSSNAAKSLSKEGVFKAEVPTLNGDIPNSDCDLFPYQQLKYTYIEYII